MKKKNLLLASLALFVSNLATGYAGFVINKSNGNVTVYLKWVSQIDDCDWCCKDDNLTLKPNEEKGVYSNFCRVSQFKITTKKRTNIKKEISWDQMGYGWELIVTDQDGNFKIAKRKFGQSKR